MKIKFLGTAAGEGIPALLCNCPVCAKTRKLRGRNLRARSQAMIDDVMLIDMPPETHSNFNRFGVNLLDIKYWLVTHIHTDHFYEDEFMFTKNGNFAHHSADWHGIDLYGSIDLKEPLDAFIRDDDHRSYIRYSPITAFTPFYCGDYKVTALKANHSTNNPFFYIIEKDGKSILYAHDTGLFKEETWEYLKTLNIKFDLVSLDCTAGALMDYNYPMHMCLGWNIQCRDDLIKNGMADENTIFVLNHFSHNGKNVTYKDFKVIAEKHGFLTSYDGLEIEF